MRQQLVVALANTLDKEASVLENVMRDKKLNNSMKGAIGNITSLQGSKAVGTLLGKPSNLTKNLPVVDLNTFNNSVSSGLNRLSEMPLLPTRKANTELSNVLKDNAYPYTRKAFGTKWESDNAKDDLKFQNFMNNLKNQ